MREPSDAEAASIAHRRHRARDGFTSGPKVAIMVSPKIAGQATTK
jgi:hypothetical protein